MFHSLPAAVIFGEIVFLLASGDDLRLRAYMAGAVLLGYLSHLVLDEIWSFGWRHGLPRLKHSFGTALKLFGQSGWANLLAYAQLAVLTAVILFKPQYPPAPALSQGLFSGQPATTRLIDCILHR